MGSRSGVGLRQGRGRDPEDLVPRLLELDRLGLGFRQTGIADADLGLRGRVFCPDHVLAENIFCHACIIPTLTSRRDRNRAPANRSGSERLRQERLHVGDERLPRRLVGAVMRAAAAAWLAAVADALEIAHRQAERVEAVIGALLYVRLDQIAAL